MQIVQFRPEWPGMHGIPIQAAVHGAQDHLRIGPKVNAACDGLVGGEGVHGACLLVEPVQRIGPNVACIGPRGSTIGSALEASVHGYKAMVGVAEGDSPCSLVPEVALGDPLRMGG